MAIVRKAQAKWQGDLLSGNGTVSFEAGALPEAPVTWKARSQSAEGKTSPEELLAGAHATCFAMALSHQLAKNGTPAQHIQANAACTFDKVGDGFRVVRMELHVEAKVPGIAPDKFAEFARTTGESGCPISAALHGNVPITVSATLL
ncbi:MAG: OsmC family peroxiredoxin [Candidatus Thermoplasmatota archaeon]|nr:OsmC family peroxiredoxin [Candidatus Thermoplasmatota archaeon]